MTRHVAFVVAGDHMVQMPISDILAVEDDRPGETCIVITRTKKHYAIAPRATIIELMADPGYR